MRKINAIHKLDTLVQIERYRVIALLLLLLLFELLLILVFRCAKTRRAVRDSSRGIEKMAIGHHIRDRATRH